MTVRLRVFTEPQQGATYDEQLRVAQAAEQLGYDAFFRSDHFLGMGTDGLPGPTDSWVTLGAIARETSTIRLGTLVTSVTFRYPGMLAVSVAQVDQMSGGRVELGVGAGWFEAEHQAYGVPFPSVAERYDMLEETLAVVTGLWTTPLGNTFDHAGPLFPISNSPGLPKPAQVPAPPLIIGGRGKRRMPALVARYAAEFNSGFDSVSTAAGLFERVRAACAEGGRDPGSLRLSNALTISVGRDDAEVARRAEGIGQDLGSLRAKGLAGTPDEVVQRLGEYAEIGSECVYLQLNDLADIDQLELIADRVLPQL